MTSGYTLRIAAACMVVLAPAAYGAEQADVLPQGKARPAIPTGHFPDRLHEFVFRNWNSVEPARMAEIVGASTGDITAMAESMGLPPAAPVPPEMKTRGYVTLLRHNWHLLPYEQLLQLVGMTQDRLAFALREDDFLWIKLGGLKPQCAPLRYRPPNEAARRRAAEIRRVIEEDFGAEIRRPEEPRFDFVRQLSSPFTAPAAPAKPADTVPLRIAYSYLAVYGDPLMNPKLDPYPDGLLERCSAVGINGVWLHAVLRELAPGGKAFPEFGKGSEERLANLRALVKRAARHGIGVYLYLNEPRAMPEAFYKSRPEMAGVREGDHAAMCTSNPAVRAWMTNALAYIFSSVPGLAGVETITASENLTNCASHGRWMECPRCKKRTDAEIIAEVNAAIEAGIHRGNPKATVLVSDWGWRSHGYAPDIIERLPKAVSLLSVSEWLKPIERGGIRSTVGEYSISAVGPGPRALKHWAAAREAGLKTAAEIQFNNSCEIASVPYLPVMDLVAEHLRNLTPARLDGMFIGWTQGGYPSVNYELAKKMGYSRSADANAALEAVAQERFGPDGAPHARKGWTRLSEAFREYPFDIRVVYRAPVSLGPANPLYPVQTGYAASMWGFPYDDLEGWRGPYPPEVFAAQFDKVAQGWPEGVAELKLAVQKTPPERRKEVQSDLRFARAAGIIFQSVANQAHYIMARDALAKNPAMQEAERERLRSRIRRSLKSEIALARQLFPIACEDSRIGFEPTCQYFYLPMDLVEKVINCRWLLAQLDQGGLDTKK